MSLPADLLALTKNVTKVWTKQRKAEERGRRSRQSREYIYSSRVDFTDVMDEILPPGYMHASGNGRNTVLKRQLYYACREAFRQKTGREITSDYFSQNLLVKFLNRHPECSHWKLAADPRGTLLIPNCGHAVRIPCGTIQVDAHLDSAKVHVMPFNVPTIRTEYPSMAAGTRYQAVVFIEKEGFGPLMEEARIAERFDVAILSCKGQSVVAARKFIDQVCRVDGGVPLFVVRDFDKSGFEIRDRLTSVSEWAEENDLVKYRFENEINVTDLGLRLADVREYGLAEERCGVKISDHWDLADEDEIEFLRSGRRVELNAFTSPQFIEWLEGKLTHHLPKRLIPKDDVLLERAYQRAMYLARLNKIITDTSDKAVKEAKDRAIPKGLRRALAKATKGGAMAWDKALYELAAAQIAAKDAKSKVK